MDMTFNMDFILGDSLQRRSSVPGSLVNRKQGLIYASSVFEDKEENMLPDSSLSPSNQNLFGYLIDESKFCDTELLNKPTDKKEVVTDMNVIGKQCRLVVDSKGEEYWVYEAHLLPVLEVRKSVFDNPAESPSKECSTTTAANVYVTDPRNGTGHLDKVLLDNDNDQILETFLYASQLALVELKLKDLEKELCSLDDYSFSRFVNSACNLKKIPGQAFLPHVADIGTTNPSAFDTEINDRDDARRIKLRQIIKKHSELKKWLSKIKKRLREKNLCKLDRIIDFSSREQTHLPLPEYSKGHEVKSILGGRKVSLNAKIVIEESSVSQVLDISHYLPHNNQSSPMQDDNGTIVQVQDSLAVACQDDKDTEVGVMDLQSIYPENTEQRDSDKPYFCDKNIFSTILALSKEGGDQEDIPLLTYEYDNYKVSKCNSDDQVVSLTDSDGLHNQNPPTPDLRRAELDCNDISEGIRILVIQKDYLRAGVINLTNKEDSDQKLWRVTLDGDRKCQDIVISEWQLLEQGVREVIPTSISQLGPGSRVCANWSVQLPMNLYPGTITRSSSSSSPLSVDDKNSVNKLSIDFDDGDHKAVTLDQVRLLPENFPNLHELMKASSIADSNFYSIDRKNRIRQKRTAKMRNEENGGICYKEIECDKNTVKIRKRANKCPDKKKKLVVHWKLVRRSDVYELVRNLDDLCIGAGDSVQLLSYSRHNYMANVVSVLARRQGPVMDLQFNWYYILADVQDNSDIVRRLKKAPISKKVIFKTSHSDINDIYSVLRKVEVLVFNEYRVKYLSPGGQRGDIPDDSYVLAGNYDQRKTRVDSLDDDLRRYILSGQD